MFDFVDVVVARTWESDQLPSSKIVVAAINRINEKAFVGVLPEHREELLGRCAREFDLTLLKAMKSFVLIACAELGKCLFIERALAIIINALNTDAIELSGRELELIALPRRPFLPGTLHVPGLRAAEGTRELLVDEKSDASLLSAGTQFVGRNEAANRRVNKSNFRRGEIREGPRGDRLRS